MSCCNNNCYNPCGSTCYKTNYNNCCVPQQPCTTTQIILPTSATVAYTAAPAVGTANIIITGSGMAANWTGDTAAVTTANTLTGGGGATICCCPCTIYGNLSGTYTGQAGTAGNTSGNAGASEYTLSGVVTITIAGGTSTLTVTSISATTSSGTAVPSVTSITGTVTCCNGIRTITFTTALAITGLAGV